MMPPGRNEGAITGGGDFNYRIPPSWDPSQESNGYSFRTYVRDVVQWTILTDLQPYQQASAIRMRLKGTARELVEHLSIQEIMHGGVVNGIQLDPVAWILHGLHTRFAPLADETRLQSMNKLINFRRRNRESVTELITRYETIRYTAHVEGNYVQSVEVCALTLIQLAGIGTNTFMQLVAPY